MSVFTLEKPANEIDFDRLKNDLFTPVNSNSKAFLQNVGNAEGVVLSCNSRIARVRYAPAKWRMAAIVQWLGLKTVALETRVQFPVAALKFKGVF